MGSLKASPGAHRTLFEMTCAIIPGRVARTLQPFIAIVALLSTVPTANASTHSIAELHPLMLSGQVAPGTNATFANANYFVANRFGDVAFRATLAPGGGVGASNNSGLWTNVG